MSPQLVLIPGWCCDAYTLGPLAGHFGPDTLTVSLHQEPADTIAQLADVVLDAIDHAGMESPVVIGHSMGGLVALDCATRTGSHGPLVAGAVLLDPAPILREKGKQFWRQAAEQLATDRDGSWRRTFAADLFQQTDRVGREEIPDLMASASPQVAAAGARAMAGFDGHAALAAARAPLLVLHAAHTEPGLHTAMGERSLLSTGQTVGSGHFPQLEVPDQVCAMVDRWLLVRGLA